MQSHAAADPPAQPLWPTVPLFPFAQSGPEQTTERPPRPGTPGPNRAVTRVSEPLLYVHQPEHPCGTAVLICPGGGFRYLEIDKEGHEIARWLASLGVTAIVLKYRTRPDTESLPRHPMPEMVRQAIVSDGLQAMRLVRAHADRWGLRGNRIGAMGFSAGGRLVTEVGTMWREGGLLSQGPLAAVNARPDFIAPIYPGIPEDMAARVDVQTPPAFMAVADDDPLVPPEHCLRLYSALRQVRVSAELHIYRRGGHGFGLGGQGSPAAHWTASFVAWLADLGMLES